MSLQTTAVNMANENKNNLPDDIDPVSGFSKGFTAAMKIVDNCTTPDELRQFIKPFVANGDISADALVEEFTKVKGQVHVETIQKSKQPERDDGAGTRRRPTDAWKRLSSILTGNRRG